jgi:hypothetical protein
MENLINDLKDKSLQLRSRFLENRLVLYGAASIYVLLWFLFSDFLTSLWVAVGVGLGWLAGQAGKLDAP